MNRSKLKDIHSEKLGPGKYNFAGWVRTHRQSKNVSFIEITDGSCIKGLQLVIDPNLSGYATQATRITTGASIRVEGELVSSPAKGQKYELRVSALELLGEADPETYPLQKKGHTFEFLREQLHLRPRSQTFGAIFRLRSLVAMAIHEFFQERGFFYLTSPIISTSDCEGAGQLFRVTTLDLLNVPKQEGKVDFTQDFFKHEASLAVSGQLEAEIFAMGLGLVYTFGPTFRAENSNTTRHLSEFWMIEPEMAFYELQDNIQLARDLVVHLVRVVLSRGAEEMEFLEAREKENTALTPQSVGPERIGLRESLQKVCDADLEVIEYTKAIEILEKSNKKYEFPVSWGMDLQSEHERYLTDEYVKGPVAVINYPKEIKPFYMRHNDDGKTVAAMDLLVPGLGEIIGGSQREERYDVLRSRILGMGFKEEDYWWYLDLRKYGTVPHAGFGLGFERFLMYVTGMHNIRDVIPVPRFPGFAKF